MMLRPAGYSYFSSNYFEIYRLNKLATRDFPQLIVKYVV